MFWDGEAESDREHGPRREQRGQLHSGRLQGDGAAGDAERVRKQSAETVHASRLHAGAGRGASHRAARAPDQRQGQQQDGEDGGERPRVHPARADGEQRPGHQ